MKKKPKTQKRKNPGKNRKKSEPSSESSNVPVQAALSANRTPFQETWKSESSSDIKTEPKKLGLLKKITNFLIHIDPKISSGDLIPKGEITAARQKMESELGDRLAKVRTGDLSSPNSLKTEDNISSTKRKKNNKTPNNIQLSDEETLLHAKDLLPQLKDSDLDHVLKSLPSNDSSSIINKVSNLGYPSYEQFYSVIGDEICGFLNDLKSTLNYRISVLRKNGGDDDEAELELMSAPLKIKIFKSSLSKSDFDKVMALLNGTASKVKLQESKLTEDKNKPDEFSDESLNENKPAPVPPPTIISPSEAPSPEKIQNPKPRKKKNQKKTTKKKSKRK